MDGTVLHCRRYTWIMLHKPAGVLSATEDGRGATVLDLLPPELRRRGLFPVGRLDKDTEGLLLLTNEGGLAHDILSPKHHVDKVYYARTAGCLTEEDCRAFAAGHPAGGEVSSGEADAGGSGKAGPLSEAGPHGQFATRSGPGTGHIPIFDGG